MRNIVLFATLLFISNSKAYSAFRTLEADYITNVFSQSNFVKNPNARVNTQSVTPSTGFAVSRSIITPLYDTSEFNVASTSATGTIDWATRAFDAGMKGQNCEARFTYRGFTGGTTKAQVVQGANTVATLDLLSSTDPKQVSINFPCGDLTQATSFRISRTIATLSGTNEIGGIYVGLATNMANVAQAEFVGAFTLGSATSCNFQTSSTSYVAFTTSDADCPTPTVEGSVAAVVGQEKTPQFTVNAQKPGRYFIIATVNLQKNGTVGAPISVVLTDGTEQSAPTSINPPNVNSANIANQHTFNWTTSGTRTIQLKFATSNALNTLVVANDTQSHGFLRADVYRFPSSSELVVKPENQENYWAAMRQTGYYDAVGGVISSAYVQYPVLDSVSRNFYGKASADISDRFVLTVPSLPVGNYKVSFKGMMVGSTSTTFCGWALHDGTNFIAGQDSHGLQYNPLIYGIYQNSKIQSKTFALWGKRFSGTGECKVQDDTEVLFTLEPLDGKSTSALYVQGPILGAQTGAAIPSGYVGEVVSSEQNSFTSGLTNGATVGLLNITLTPGTWLISASQSVVQNGSTGTALSSVLSDVSATGNTITGLGAGGNDLGAWPPNNTTQSSVTHPSFIYSTTTSKIIYLNTYSVFSSGTPLRRGSIRAIRIN